MHQPLEQLECPPDGQRMIHQDHSRVIRAGKMIEILQRLPRICRNMYAPAPIKLMNQLFQQVLVPDVIIR